MHWQWSVGRDFAPTRDGGAARRSQGATNMLKRGPLSSPKIIKRANCRGRFVYEDDEVVGLLDHRGDGPGTHVVVAASRGRSMAEHEPAVFGPDHVRRQLVGKGRLPGVRWPTAPG